MIHAEHSGPTGAAQATTLILGIGNTLLSDEGAGVHAIRRLEAHCIGTAGVRLLDGGTLSFALAGDIGAAERLIVIDAAELGLPPGSVATFLDEDMDAFLGANRRHSVHEVGLLDLLQISRLTGQLPVKRALIGIQPASLEWGEQPSAGVDAGIAIACERAVALLGRWSD